MARYTEAEKADAVALYLEHGLAEAHHRTGIARTNLQRWLKDAGHDLDEPAVHTAAKTEAARAAKTLAWAERRVTLTDEFGDVAELALSKARELINLGKTSDAQKAMVVAAIGTDKAQLLSGHATSRTETLAPDRNPEYEEVLDRTIRLVQDKAS